MTGQPYHRFVFDGENRRFVGAFDEMYQAEEEEGFDSWFSSDQRHVHRQLGLALLSRYNFDRILSFGCGKGHFLSQLKRENNTALGLDVSPTAVEKARQTYRDIRFEVVEDNDLAPFEPLGPFDLAVAAEVLSYVEDWRGVLDSLARLASHLYVTLYVPPDPIGFVKSIEELEEGLATVSTPLHKIIHNDESLIVLARSKKGPS